MRTATARDVELTCCECGQPFLWEAGEQRFYAIKNYPPPRRCPACRVLKRQRFSVEPSLGGGVRRLID